MSVPRIAIIGAGIAGAALARDLADGGLTPDIFEKSRGVGGRMATRRRDSVQMDHGAPWFAGEPAAFAATVADWRARGIVAPGAAGDVGQPGMSAPAKDLLSDLPVAFAARVTGLSREGTAWRVQLEAETRGPYDMVLSAAPGPQIAPLFAAAGVALPGLDQVTYHPGWTLLVAWDKPVALCPGDPQDQLIAKLIHDGAKPGRSGHAWVAHARDDWAAQHLEGDPSEAEARLAAALDRLSGAPLPPPVYRAAHRWRYARTATPLGQPCLWRPGDGVGLCGDWCLGPNVGDAVVSGRALAAEVLAHLS